MILSRSGLELNDIWAKQVQALSEADPVIQGIKRQHAAEPGDAEAHKKKIAWLGRTGQQSAATEEQHRLRLRHDPKVYVKETEAAHYRDPAHLGTLRRYRDAVHAAHPEVVKLYDKAQIARENSHHRKASSDATSTRETGLEGAREAMDRAGKANLTHTLAEAKAWREAKKTGHSASLFRRFLPADESVKKETHPRAPRVGAHHATHRFLRTLSTPGTYVYPAHNDPTRPHEAETEGDDHSNHARRWSNLAKINFPNAKISHQHVPGVNTFGDDDHRGHTVVQVHNLRQMKARR